MSPYRKSWSYENLVLQPMIRSSVGARVDSDRRRLRGHAHRNRNNDGYCSYKRRAHS